MNIEERDKKKNNLEINKEKRERRFRNLLKDYYGFGEQTEQSSDIPKDTSINGSYFDSQKYFEQILKENSLSELIKLDNKLISEIRNLDSDMKTLVYENYNKFISATETIKKMKSHVDNMSQEMKLLSNNMDIIDKCSTKLDNTISERREKIEKLSSIHRLLKKLQFLVELPTRLQQAIKLEAYSSAVKYYSITNGILKRYENIPSFKSIQQECKEIINNLKVELQKKIQDPKSPSPTVTESIQLLLQLDEDNKNLAEQYLQIRRKKLEIKLKEFESQIEKLNHENSELENIIGLLNKNFFQEFIEFCNSFKNLFPSQSSTNKLFQDTFKDLFMQYLSTLKQILQKSNSTSNTLISLSILYEDLQRISLDIPDLGINEKMNHFINSSIHNQIEKQFSNLQNKIKDSLKNIQIITLNLFSQPFQVKILSEWKPLELCTTTFNDILTGIQVLLDDLKLLFETNNIPFLKNQSYGFISKIHVKIQQFFLFLNITILEYYEDTIQLIKDDVKWPPLNIFLLFAHLCTILESQGVPKVVNFLLKLKQSSLEQPKKNQIQHFEINEININEMDLRNRLKNTTETFLNWYIRHQSIQLSSIISKSINVPNWLQINKAPKGPRSVIEVLLEEIQFIYLQINAVFGDIKLEENLNPSINHLQPKFVSIRALHQQKQKKNELQSTKNLIISEIIKNSLKSFIEFSRLKTFNKFGFQQLQVDIYFLKTKLESSFIEKDNENLTNIFEEIISSITERCTEVVALSKDIIINLCKEKEEEEEVK